MVVLNTHDTAVLYCRSHDSKGLIPFRIFELRNRRLGSLDRRVVRFEVTGANFVPIGVCKHEQCDFVGYAESVLIYVVNGFDALSCLSKCQEELKLIVSMAGARKKWGSKEATG
jgi:hypothetical protein